MIKQTKFKKSSTRKFKTRPSSRTALKTVIALFFMLPLMFVLFILDRVILLPILGKTAPSFQLWYDNNTEMARSVIRVLLGYSIIGLAWLVVWLVQNYL
jgi:hypothetical protein